MVLVPAPASPPVAPDIHPQRRGGAWLARAATHAGLSWLSWLSWWGSAPGDECPTPVESILGRLRYAYTGVWFSRHQLMPSAGFLRCMPRLLPRAGVYRH